MEWGKAWNGQDKYCSNLHKQSDSYRGNRPLPFLLSGEVSTDYENIFNSKMLQKLTFFSIFNIYFSILNKYFICDVIFPFPFSVIWKKHLIDIL